MAKFYVSTTGNDNADGLSVATAFKSLAQAQTAMRTSAGDDITDVRGGVYEFKTPLTLTAADNGSTFQAYLKEKPVLSGGTAISNWQKGADGIWTAKLTSHTDLQQLTVNGVNQTEARYPNETPDSPLRGGWAWSRESSAITDHTTQLAFDPGDFKAGQIVKGMKVSVHTDLGWSNNVLTIASVDAANGVMTFTSPADYELGPRSRFFLSDGKVHLDKPGEWWFDSATKTVHFKAPEGFSGTGAVASGTNAIVEIQDATDITFSGFTFSDAVTAAPNSDFQSAGVTIFDSTSITLSGNTFLNLGKGIFAGGASSDLTIANNDFRHIWSAGVDLEDGTHHNKVTGNSMQWLGEVFVPRGAISMHESYANTISGNLIRDVPRGAIMDVHYNPQNQSGGHLIEKNIIIHSVRETPDFGPIYVYASLDPGHSGDTICYNRVIDSQGLEAEIGGFRPGQQYSHGIYIDDFSSNNRIYQNFVQGAVQGGIYFHGGDNNIAHDNVVIENKHKSLLFMPIDGQAMTGNQMYNNIVAGYWSTEYGNTVELDPALVAGSSLFRNFYIQSAGLSMSFNDKTLAQWQAAGYDIVSTVSGLSPFVNPHQGDFSLLPGSPLIKAGFNPLPWDLMSTFRGGLVVTGTLGKDFLTGGKTNDIIDGLAGDDLLAGGAGADELVGGDGIDTATYLSASAGVVASLRNVAINTGDAKGDVYDRVNNLQGSVYADKLHGNDWANKLWGNAGNDWMWGGLGRDTLVGGAGADTFVFTAIKESTVAARDIIDGFSLRRDKIDLQAIDADPDTGGNQAFRFLGSKAFDGADAALRVIKSANDTQLLADLDGNGIADFAITIKGAVDLSAVDVLL